MISMFSAFIFSCLCMALAGVAGSFVHFWVVFLPCVLWYLFVLWVDWLGKEVHACTGSV